MAFKPPHELEQIRRIHIHRETKAELGNTAYPTAELTIRKIEVSHKLPLVLRQYLA